MRFIFEPDHTSFLVDLGDLFTCMTLSLVVKPRDRDEKGATHHVCLRDGKWQCDPLWDYNERGHLVLHPLFYLSDRAEGVLTHKRAYGLSLARSWGITK